MLTCGIAVDRDYLVVRLVASDGRSHPPMRLRRTAEERTRLLDRLEYIYSPDWDIVLGHPLLADEPLPYLALQRAIPLWLAPRPLLYALRLLVRCPPSDALAIATLLARMPRCPFLRRYLDRIDSTDRRSCRLLPPVPRALSLYMTDRPHQKR